MKTLAIRLTADFGAGFTAANLFNMRQFYLAFPNFYTLCRELSWSHYRLLMRNRIDPKSMKALNRERAAIEEVLAMRK